MDARVHAVAFLTSVFNEASKVISTIHVEGMDSYDDIVNLFSKHMSEGMNFENHGDNRCTFFDNVVLGASQVR